MNRRALTALVLVFAFLGIADSTYLAHASLTDTSLTCNIKGLEGCNVVAQSAYSHVFGIPLGVYGVVFYALVFLSAAFLLAKRSREGHLLLWVLAWLGLAASIIFELIQVFLIKAICVYCLGSAVLSLLVWLASFWLWKKFAPRKLASIPPMESTPGT